MDTYIHKHTRIRFASLHKLPPISENVTMSYKNEPVVARPVAKGHHSIIPVRFPHPPHKARLASLSASCYSLTEVNVMSNRVVGMQGQSVVTRPVTVFPNCKTSLSNVGAQQFPIAF